MQEIQIDKSELERLISKLDAAPEVLRAAKKKAVAAAGPKLKQAVDAQIGGSGKVRSWQGQFTGSKGGYAAVRPLAKAYTDPTKHGKRYAVGYVTNAVNSGHKFPAPTGKNNRYKPRIRSGRLNVPGKRFYEAAGAQTEQIAREAGDQIIQELTQHLGG